MPAAPEANYVLRLLERLKAELNGRHIKMEELERLRYYEDTIAIRPEDKRTNIEVRIGFTAEMVESIKAASTANPPRVILTPHRSGIDAGSNVTNREKFWNEFLIWSNHPVPTLSELIDSSAGLGIGILKTAFMPWPTEGRRRLKGEEDADYNDRQKGLKRMWGPPFGMVNIHPLTYYERLGRGNQIVESVEHSYKPKLDVYRQYGFNDSQGMMNTNFDKYNGIAISGLPSPTVKPLPIGVSTETMALVTEYWNRDWYQVYIDGNMVYEERDPSVCYFVCTGRSSSSRDPDKFGISIAEIMRHNEPVLNRVLTKMAEAADMTVKKRLTVEFPEGSVDNTTGFDDDNNPIMRRFEFNQDYAESLPAGAKVIDPFEGAYNVYAAMPFVELMLSIMGRHGVAPIFKGVSPGAAGSGYRDNSLYEMAKAIYDYMLDSYRYCIADAIKWFEWLIVHKVRQTVWCGQYSLSPKDIAEWPADLEVVIEPKLPSNLIAEGNFFDQMHARGHITRRRVQEQGIGIDSPEEESKQRLLEDLQAALTPALLDDVLSTVIPQPPAPTILGPNGEPLPPSGGANGNTPPILNGERDPSANALRPGLGQRNGQIAGGNTRGGQPNQPLIPPGGTM